MTPRPARGADIATAAEVPVLVSALPPPPVLAQVVNAGVPTANEAKSPPPVPPPSVTTTPHASQARRTHSPKLRESPQVPARQLQERRGFGNPPIPTCSNRISARSGASRPGTLRFPWAPSIAFGSSSWSARSPRCPPLLTRSPRYRLPPSRAKQRPSISRAPPPTAMRVTRAPSSIFRGRRARPERRALVERRQGLRQAR